MAVEDGISAEERDADDAEDEAWQNMSTEEKARALAEDEVYVEEVREARDAGHPVDYQDWQTLQAAEGSDR